MILVCMEREFYMSSKYTVTENFKSAEKDRKISFLNKLVKIVNETAKSQTDKIERWKRT